MNRRFSLFLALLVIAACITLYGAAETFVRVRQQFRFGGLARIEDTYLLDPSSGLRTPVPGGSFGPIRINSLGFRGPELEVPKPPSMLRIAFLGSSTTYCAEVSSNEQTWPALVTEALKTEWPGVKADYVNAGVPGYALTESLKNLEYRVAPLDPDIIVIYEGHNDLSGKSFELATKQGLVSTPTERNLSWPAKYSLFWYLVEKNIFILQQRQLAQHANGKLTFDEQALTDSFRRDLRQLVAASQRVASLVVLVTFSTQLRREQTSEQQARAAETSLYYMPYMSIDGLIHSYRSYNNVVREVAGETGALLIDAENAIPGNPEYFVDSVHFTDKGSNQMAKQVSKVLVASQALQQLVSARR